MKSFGNHELFYELSRQNRVGRVRKSQMSFLVFSLIRSVESMHSFNVSKRVKSNIGRY